MFGFNDKIKTFCWGHYIAKMCMDYCLVSMHLYSRATKIDTLYMHCFTEKSLFVLAAPQCHKVISFFFGCCGLKYDEI